MLKFVSSKLAMLVLISGGFACSENSVNTKGTRSSGNEKVQQNSMFSGVSRSSQKQQTLATNKQSSAKSPFSEVVPGYQITFPHDHASHPDFAVEWWYITANLTDSQHRAYAVQWTLFRFASEAMTTPWANAQQFMGHVGIRSGDQAWFEERFARGGVGNAGVSTLPFNGFIDNWQWRASTEQLFPSTLEFTIEPQITVRLNLAANKPYVKHGEQGFSRKLRNAEQASYYYSQPFIQVTGELDLPSGKVEVVGNAWYDHEWTSQYLSPGALGWDWFSIHLDNGAKLMMFNMRHEQAEDYWSGTFIAKDGHSVHLAESDIQASVIKLSQVEGRTLPLHWSIKLAKQGIDIQIAPMQLNQWNPGMFSYYEGGTEISGSHSGVGFIELTGY